METYIWLLNDELELTTVLTEEDEAGYHNTVATLELRLERLAKLLENDEDDEAGYQIIVVLDDVAAACVGAAGYHTMAALLLDEDFTGTLPTEEFGEIPHEFCRNRKMVANRMHASRNPQSTCSNGE